MGLFNDLLFYEYWDNIWIYSACLRIVFCTMGIHLLGRWAEVGVSAHVRIWVTVKFSLLLFLYSLWFALSWQHDRFCTTQKRKNSSEVCFCFKKKKQANKHSRCATKAFGSWRKLNWTWLVCAPLCRSVMTSRAAHRCNVSV